METKDWLLIVGAVITFAGSILAARYAGRSSVKVAEIGADEGAFMRAKQIYEGAIAQLEKERAEKENADQKERAEQRERFERELAEQRTAFDRERMQARAEDRARIEKLEHQVTALKARLAHEGIDVSDLDLD